MKKKEAFYCSKFVLRTGGKIHLGQESLKYKLQNIAVN